MFALRGLLALIGNCTSACDICRVAIATGSGEKCLQILNQVLNSLLRWTDLIHTFLKRRVPVFWIGKSRRDDAY